MRARAIGRPAWDPAIIVLQLRSTSRPEPDGLQKAKQPELQAPCYEISSFLFPCPTRCAGRTDGEPTWRLPLSATSCSCWSAGALCWR